MHIYLSIMMRRCILRLDLLCSSHRDVILLKKGRLVDRVFYLVLYESGFRVYFLYFLMLIPNLQGLCCLLPGVKIHRIK